MDVVLRDGIVTQCCSCDSDACYMYIKDISFVFVRLDVVSMCPCGCEKSVRMLV